ncbi:MAG: zinc metalloprotease HtpX [Candidatus Hodarchaeales archaeon]|jgi:heat shock protein HtpX
MDIVNLFKTGILFTILIGIFYVISIVFNVPPAIFLVFSGLFVIISYWFSDSLILKITRAQIVDPTQAPELHSRVQYLAERAGIPKPRIAIVQNQTPNAFATGRSPGKAVIAVHTGLLQMMTPDELDGVIAHELSHVKHWDTLIQTIAAVFASAIMFVSRMALWFSFSDRESVNPITLIVTWIVAPIAAILVQLAISRNREYAADKAAARITGNPLGLAHALDKLGSYSRSTRYFSRRQPTADPSISHLYIANPLSSNNLAGLFSTHPPIEERIARLQQMTYY